MRFCALIIYDPRHGHTMDILSGGREEKGKKMVGNREGKGKLWKD